MEWRETMTLLRPLCRRGMIDADSLSGLPCGLRGLWAAGRLPKPCQRAQLSSGDRGDAADWLALGCSPCGSPLPCARCCGPADGARDLKPADPWWIWVTRDGRLLVTLAHAPQPEPTAWPVAGEPSHGEAQAACLTMGMCDGIGGRAVPGFGGTIGALMELRQRFVHRRQWREQHGQGRQAGHQGGAVPAPPA
jgi:hypothetical protein